MKDQGTFHGKGIKTQFSTFMKADDDVLDAFRDFGTSCEIPERLIAQMEKFVCSLYSIKNRKSIKGRPSSLDFKSIIPSKHNLKLVP